MGPDWDGDNHLHVILGQCAIQEDWHDANGFDGKGWFVVDPKTGTLTHFWLTSQAYEAAGIIKRVEVPSGSPSTIRVQRTVALPSGASILDRATMTPRGDGTVHQLIEVSIDCGKTWTSRYDAIYRRIR